MFNWFGVSFFTRPGLGVLTNKDSSPRAPFLLFSCILRPHTQAVVPFWCRLRRVRWFKSSLNGVNASAIGLVGAACIILYEGAVNTTADAVSILFCSSSASFLSSSSRYRSSAPTFSCRYLFISAHSLSRSLTHASSLCRILDGVRIRRHTSHGVRPRRAARRARRRSFRCDIASGRVGSRSN